MDVYVSHPKEIVEGMNQGGPESEILSQIKKPDL